MKTTVKIVNVKNVNQNNRMLSSQQYNMRWTRKDDNILIECLKDAVKESRSQISGFEECAMLTGRTVKSVSVRYYQYIRTRLKEPLNFPRGNRSRKPVKKTVNKVEKQTTIIRPSLDLHYVTTKELFNKLSLEKKLRLISECIACSL